MTDGRDASMLRRVGTGACSVPLMGSLLRKIVERGRADARQPGSWAVFVFFGVVNTGQAIFADSVMSRMVYLALAGTAMFIALRFFRASRAARLASTSRSDT